MAEIATDFIVPVGSGYDDDYNEHNDYTAGYGYHLGVDYSNGSYGGRVSASANGVVIFAGVHTNSNGTPGFGNIVVIEHTLSDGSKVTTYYAHLDTINVTVGQDVLMGDKIGSVGSSGNSTGPHLHFQMFVGDDAPMPSDATNPLLGYSSSSDPDIRDRFVDPELFIEEFDGPSSGPTNGSDNLSLGSSSDSTHGMDGSDTISGNDGNDTIWGDSQNDTIYGGNGRDSLLGGLDQDEIYGGSDNDSIDGEQAVDYLDGGSGNDAIYGGDGNDTIDGGTGNDYINGWNDIDTATFIYSNSAVNVGLSNSGNGSASGSGIGNDVLVSIENVQGSNFNDVISGNSSTNNILGASGNDTIRGYDGDDVLKGQAGSDSLLGDANNDKLYGEAGTDKLQGGSGNDRLDGGDSSDSLYGESGNDNCFGGSGSDSFYFYSSTGKDKISDFSDNSDTVFLDDALWGGVTLSVSSMLTKYARDTGSDVVLDFGGGNTITFVGLSSVSLLSDDVTIF